MRIDFSKASSLIIQTHTHTPCTGRLGGAELLLCKYPFGGQPGSPGDPKPLRFARPVERATLGKGCARLPMVQLPRRKTSLVYKGMQLVVPPYIYIYREREYLVTRALQLGG